MYFCPNCSYLFDISKSSTVSNNDDIRVLINKTTDALKLLEEKEDIGKYKASFTKDIMAKNKKYQKLSDEDKIKINVLFEEVVSSGAEFKCENCSFTKQITETTVLYQVNMEDKNIKIKSIEENELMCKDPILPHTHDYTCKNPTCISHKDLKIKDAIFYKDRNSYKVNYICTICFYNW
jgi:hypothetical protein